MHVHFRRTGAALLLAFGGAVVSASCARDDSSLFIRGCMDVPRDTCVVMPTVDSVLLLGGLIDTTVRSEYHCVALFENQLVPRGDQNKLRTETSRIELYEANVQVLNTTNQIITRSDGSAAQYTIPITGFADPSMGTDPGIGATDLIMIDFTTLQNLANAAIATKLAQQVQVSVILRGHTLGGLEVHSNEFLYPITVCAGCLCANPVGDSCLGGSDKPAADCRLGLDASVDCRYLTCDQLECPDGTLESAQCPFVAGQPNAALSCCGATP